MKKTFIIKGMHCNSCAILTEKELKDKVNNISVSYSNEKAEIDFDENKINESEIIEIIKKLGYHATPENAEKIEKENNNSKNQFSSFEKILFWSIIIIIPLLLLYKFTGFSFSNFNLPDIQIPELGDKASLALLFLAGILTGFHCVSMCGGFVVSYTAKNALNGYKGFKQHLVYGGSKVLSYTIIGGIFGLIGGIFAFSIKLRGVIAILAGLFMIFYALSMFGFKFFRKFQLNPKFLTNAATKANNSAHGHFRAPFITGLLNGLFLACGPLQAMYLYAMGTGSFLSGAASLAVFGLGTLPVMLGFGFIATTISHKTTGRILKISAVIVLILGLIMLNRGLSLTGSNFSFDTIKTSLAGGAIIANANGAIITNGVQEINMNVDASGYSPNSFVLKKGVPVKWNVNVVQLTGCNNELVIGEYNIDKRLKSGLNVIEFTPTKTGTITFTCGMGMLRGSFIVTEDGTASQSQVQAATPPKGSSCSMGANGGGCGCGG
ncbi:MAG: sulfite exporter TauE/SafE family protein [Nanoarchaeota archaeon]